MTMVVDTDEDGAHRIEANLYKLVNVLRVENITDAAQRDPRAGADQGGDHGPTRGRRSCSSRRVPRPHHRLSARGAGARNHRRRGQDRWPARSARALRHHRDGAHRHASAHGCAAKARRPWPAARLGRGRRPGGRCRRRQPIPTSRIPCDSPPARPSCSQALSRRSSRHGRHLLRQGRRPAPDPRTQGRDHRLRLAGPRPRAQPAGQRRRRARRALRRQPLGGQGAGRRPAHGLDCRGRRARPT